MTLVGIVAHILKFWSLGAEAGGMYILDLLGLYSDKNTDRGGAQGKK